MIEQEEHGDAQSASIYEVIVSRNTAHFYEERPVSQELLHRALRAAIRAPNHKLTNPWRFIRVGEKTRAEITELDACTTAEAGAAISRAGQKFFDEIAASKKPIVAAIESVIAGSVTIIGKPQRTFFDAALSRTGFVREDTVMVGDSIASDISGAINAGLRSLLVRTGNSAKDAVPPGCDGALDSIADLPQWCDSHFPN